MIFNSKQKIFNSLKKGLKSISKILFSFIFSIETTETKSKSWLQKNIGNIVSTILIVLVSTILSSINSVKAQEKLILKKIIHIEDLLKSEHQIYTRKIKENKNINANYFKLLNTISFSKKDLNSSNIFEKTKKWKTVLNYYLENENVYKENSTFMNKDITRKKNKLESAIFRYNKEVDLLNQWLVKFPNRQLKSFLKVKNHKLFDIDININNYKTYE